MVFHSSALVTHVCVPIGNFPFTQRLVSVNIEKVLVTERVLLVFKEALLKYSVGLPLISAPELYDTVHDAVTALAPVPADPLLVQVVIVHPDVVQFVPLSALSQRIGLATQPGLIVRLADTTALSANAELLVRTRSPELLIVHVKVTVVPLAASVGTTGIRSVSVPNEARAVVLVQVTPVPTCAPHDQPLSENELAGPVIFAGI